MYNNRYDTVYETNKVMIDRVFQSAVEILEVFVVKRKLAFALHHFKRILPSLEYK